MGDQVASAYRQLAFMYKSWQGQQQTSQVATPGHAAINKQLCTHVTQPELDAKHMARKHSDVNIQETPPKKTWFLNSGSTLVTGH